jgi:hypothetical protein
MAKAKLKIESLELETVIIGRPRHKEANMNRQCVHCGCTTARACKGGCYWSVLHVATNTGVCSRCVPEEMKIVVALLKSPVEQDKLLAAEMKKLKVFTSALQNAFGKHI